MSTPAPPIARADASGTTVHGTFLADPYAWLRDKESPETIAYLEAENAHTAAAMAGTGPLQQKLYDEMLSHLKQTDEAVPYLKDGYYYSNRTEEGKQYTILCRRKGSLDAPEEIILDVNQLAQGHTFMSLGAVAITPDGRWLAYTTDNVGFRQYTLHIRDLATGEDLPDTAQRVGSVVWAADNATLFYTQEDEVEKRQHRLYRHVRGQAGEHTLVLEEPDERFNLAVTKTRSRAYILLLSGSHTTSEVRFIPAGSPLDNWQVLEPRRPDIEYYAEERHGTFYIRVNDTARTFRLVTAPVATPGSAHWTELIPAHPDVPLEDAEVFEDFYTLEERIAGLPRLRVTLFADNSSREIAFPDPAYTVHTTSNAEFRTTFLRYAYQSLVQPASVYDYDITTGESTLRKQTEIPGGFDPALYTSERVFATAEDGAGVPISLVYRKDSMQRDGTNPLFVYGYGSYGYALPIGFNGNRLSLLDRGFVMAYAHIRGGGDLGQPWHDAGRMMVKRNTFTDFIACVEYLTSQGYGDPSRVAIEGGSAGGLLMGAVVNLRPELFRAVVSHVPFVDVMNTMLDASLPLTVPEYEEWGNPNEEEAFRYMLSYSPYENLREGAYPAMLVKTSLHDSQVMYWEPAKYVARLRTLKQDSRPLLLHTNLTAGHGGASGRYDYLKEIAFDYAFLLRELGVE